MTDPTADLNGHGIRTGHKRKREAGPAPKPSVNPFHKSDAGPNRHHPKSESYNGEFTKSPKSVGTPGVSKSNDHPMNSKLKQKQATLLKFRKELPIWASATSIRSSLAGQKDVMVLVGETGSGKSTQVPQFLMNEPWCKGRIAITQPRRVAAISLARRVAEEMGTPLGSSSPASKVGYSVRFDKSVSPNTKVKFLTEGMLLQEMLHDPNLLEYSAVIVDEVHERSVNVDLILGFLRRLLAKGLKARKGKSLKVVVMSATADVNALVNFFELGNKDRESNLDHAKSKTENTKSALTDTNRVVACHVPGRLFPVNVTHLKEPTQDFVEESLKIIFQIHYKEPLPGDILVFLTGQDTVESLERLVNDYASAMNPEVPKIIALPLFAALPQSAQQNIFMPAPFKTRKVILSTNIAETSVTVPGVRFVIDCGKMKVKQYRSRLGLDSLLVKPVSKSSAIQRKGRAGREAAGHCYRLYTKQDYESLQQDTTPEILRCDLSDALLGMKARGIDDVLNFPFLDPPPREPMEKALFQLLELGALNEIGQISDVGSRMAKLPLPPSLGRVIIEASQQSQECLLDVVDIVAALTVESIFINLATEETREAAEEPRRELFRREGDHLTLLSTVRAYAAEQTDRKSWSKRYFVSHRAMQNVMDVRKQLFLQCKQLKILPEDASLDSTESNITEARSEEILKSLLRGFSHNTARIVSDGSYRTLEGNQTVAIHPSSVLFGRKLEAILFTEYVFTSKSYARNVSAVQLGWIDEVVSRTD